MKLSPKDVVEISMWYVLYQQDTDETTIRFTYDPLEEIILIKTEQNYLKKEEVYMTPKYLDNFIEHLQNFRDSLKKLEIKTK